MNKYIFTFICLVLVGFGIIQMVVAHKLGIQSQYVSKLTDTITSIQSDNMTLEEKIASESSLSTILQKASILGLREATLLVIKEPRVAYNSNDQEN